MKDDDERQARLAAIRKRLAEATPGPWQTWTDGTEESVESVSVGRFVCHLNSNMRQFHEDAALIANAPADLAWLLAELEAAEARAGRAERALRNGVRMVNGTLDAVGGSSCPCSAEEFCDECLAVKTLEDTAAALAEGA